MEQDEIIKVPPAYIVSRYTAQTTLKQCPYLKAVDFTNGTIGIQVEAGIDYADTAVKYLGTKRVLRDGETIYCNVSMFTIKVPKATLLALLAGNFNIRLSLPAGFYNYVTFVDTYHGSTPQPVAISGGGSFSGDIDTFTLNYGQVAGIAAGGYAICQVSYYCQDQTAYQYIVNKPYYPFSYTEKTIGSDNSVKFITLDNPPFVDIDINELFYPAGLIPSAAAGDYIYLLHKNSN